MFDALVPVDREAEPPLVGLGDKRCPALRLVDKDAAFGIAPGEEAGGSDRLVEKGIIGIADGSVETGPDRHGKEGVVNGLAHGETEGDIGEPHHGVGVPLCLENTERSCL